MNSAHLVIAFALLTLSLIANADTHKTSSQFKITEITPSLMLLQGNGGNIALSSGKDGLLIVDDDYAEMSAPLKNALENYGGVKQLKYILNTHWHGDHTGGNASLGAEVNIVAHQNVRQRLSTKQEIPLFKMVSLPQPAHALPNITYPESMTLHFNNEIIRLEHYPSGHTDGDSVIFFELANVVHMGDHMFNQMYPFIDINSGGNVLAYTQNIKNILQKINDDTVVIPGHGSPTNKKGLNAYHQMLTGTISEVTVMKDEGLTLQQAQTKGLNDQWKTWNNGFIKQDIWISLIYQSL